MASILGLWIEFTYMRFSNCLLPWKSFVCRPYFLSASWILISCQNQNQTSQLCKWVKVTVCVGVMICLQDTQTDCCSVVVATVIFQLVHTLSLYIISNGLLQCFGGETMLGRDHHEWGRNAQLNSHRHYSSEAPVHNDSMGSSASTSHHWNDSIPSGSGQGSLYSWGIYEAVRHIHSNFPSFTKGH